MIENEKGKSTPSHSPIRSPHLPDSQLNAMHRVYGEIPSFGLNPGKHWNVYVALIERFTSLASIAPVGATMASAQ